ncbi:hypothetical protein A5644_03505 [Mycobacterium intracellulare subsp. yongonense]|nr:hypothetical protein A5644_03505 [Mycobacterium intracellulare subsp. yongonense]
MRVAMSVVSPSAASMSASRTAAGGPEPAPVRKRYCPSGWWAPMRDQSAIVGELLLAPRVALIASFVLEGFDVRSLSPLDIHSVGIALDLHPRGRSVFG